jgi:dolichol-phosphate mannosyltransferase
VRVWLVLPAYNEGANLTPLLTGVRKLRVDAPQLDVRVIVVDDGSADDTATVAQREAASMPLDLLPNVQNRGLAYTFKRGVMAAAQQADATDIIVCMDADNSHLPEQIPLMAREIEQGNDVVIASRYRTGAVTRNVSALSSDLSGEGGARLLMRLSRLPGGFFAVGAGLSGRGPLCAGRLRLHGGHTPPSFARERKIHGDSAHSSL